MTKPLDQVTTDPTQRLYDRIRLIEERLSRVDAVRASGSAGLPGDPGADGRDAGLNFKWATATSGDPGSGKVRTNHATFASVTSLGVSETDDDGSNLAALLAVLDDPTSAVRGHVVLRKVGAPGSFAIYALTGAATDQGTYWTFPVTPVEAAGTFSANDELMLNWARTGDKGDTGSTGSTGSAGPQGPAGTPGPGTLHTTTASTSGPTTTSTANPPTTTLSEMSITADFGGNPVIAFFTGTFSHPNDDADIRVAIRDAGTVKQQRRARFAPSTSTQGQVIAATAAWTPASGSRTIDVTWSTSLGTATADLLERQLVILELG